MPGKEPVKSMHMSAHIQGVGGGRQCFFKEATISYLVDILLSELYSFIVIILAVMYISSR